MEPVDCERMEPGVQRNHSSSLYGFATEWQLVLRLTRSSVLGWWLLLVQGHRSRSPRPRLWCARDVPVGGQGAPLVWSAVCLACLFLSSLPVFLQDATSVSRHRFSSETGCASGHQLPLVPVPSVSPKEALSLRGYKGPFSLKHTEMCCQLQVSAEPLADTSVRKRSDAAMLAPGGRGRKG